jgi:hypothetical protein
LQVYAPQWSFVCTCPHVFALSGYDFLRHVFNEGAPFLESITGLEALQAATATLELTGVDEADADFKFDD